MNVYEILLLYQIITIALVLYIAKPKILKAIFKNRFINFVFLDTGDIGYAIANKNMHFRFDEKEYVVNPDKKYHGIYFYITKQSEPLELEYNKNKCEYYINSDEFTTVIHNSVFSKLMLSRESDMLKTVFILSIISIGIGILVWWSLHNIQSQLEWFRQIVQQNQNIIKVR